MFRTCILLALLSCVWAKKWPGAPLCYRDRQQLQFDTMIMQPIHKHQPGSPWNVIFATGNLVDEYDSTIPQTGCNRTYNEDRHIVPHSDTVRITVGFYKPTPHQYIIYQDFKTKRYINCTRQRTKQVWCVFEQCFNDFQEWRPNGPQLYPSGKPATIYYGVQKHTKNKTFYGDQVWWTGTPKLGTPIKWSILGDVKGKHNFATIYEAIYSNWRPPSKDAFELPSICDTNTTTLFQQPTKEWEHPETSPKPFRQG
eukprot:TRINITY_DN29285_c0_g1_i1.p1 TRINITY_DN29285_c0_g1~~TRINITY_DN29285_c0_g1_i1.p1  ORF type:complete len:254 (+),score=-0.60 TRINITY_DN29285_c0_g1_i1:25-786(+)